MSLRPGARFGRYEILKSLGTGGMGDVYLAEDTRLRRQVALKRLSERRPRLGRVDGALLHEARAVATLNHPNIAAVYDVLDAEDGAFIVMEYVEGETLANRLSRGKPLPQETTGVVTQLLSALGEAHRHGIIHRDLKPSNVMITPDGVAKVLDFGVARTRTRRDDDATAEGPYTAARVIVGTPGYAAPEQLLGRNADERSDIYSVGVLLYELLAGRLPHISSGMFDAALAAATENPQPLTSVAGVSPPLAAVVERAMAFDPKDRFASAGEMTTALTAAVRGEWWPEAKSRTPDPRAVLAVVLLVALAVAAPLWWMWRDVGAVRAAPRPIVAVLPLGTLSGDASTDAYAIGIVETVTTNLARLSSIVVVPATETADSRRQGRTPSQVARDTGATFLVGASVQQAGDQLGVNLHLLAGDGHVVWAERFEGRIAELFVLQHRMTEAIIRRLQVSLTPSPVSRLESRPVNVVDVTEYWQGRALLDRYDMPGNLVRAIEVFERVIARDPSFALAHAALGEAYWQRYESTDDAAWTTKAIEHAETAVRLEPDETQARYSLAVILRGTGRLAEAAKELERVTASAPNHPQAPYLLGVVLANSGRIDDAVAALQRAIELRPHYVKNYSELFVVLLESGRYADAESLLLKAVALNPDSPVPFQQLGALHQTTGRIDEAIKWYQESLKRAPLATSYSNLGMSLHQRGRFGEAAEAYEHALRLSPKSPVTHRNLGDTYRRLDRHDDARAAYMRAIALTETLLKVNPRDPTNLSRLAVYKAKLGRRLEAERHLQQAIAIRPKDGGVWFRKAVVASLQGDAVQALDALRQAIAFGYSRSTIRDEEDLERLRGRPDFQELVTSK